MSLSKRAKDHLELHDRLNPIKSYNFIIYMDKIPAAKRPRGRILVVNGIATISLYAADKMDSKNLRNLITAELPEDFKRFNGAVQLEMDVSIKYPASMSNFKIELIEAGYIQPETRPDYDNYAKLITDSMNGLVFKDDSQVTVGKVTKLYSATPSIKISISGRIHSILSSLKEINNECGVNPEGYTIETI